MKLSDILEKITPLDKDKIATGQLFCDRLAKPPGSLGQLEVIYARLYALFDGKISLDKKVTMVYVADNGVVEENVSSNSPETTYRVAKNMLQGQSAICAMSRHIGSEVCVIDIGCKKEIFEGNCDKVRPGTDNMLQRPAMSREEAEHAILTGYRRTVEKIQQGYSVFGTGEMGIGNTTTSAAVISVLLGVDPAIVTGYGAGLTEEGKSHKLRVIKQSIARHAPYGDVLDVVAKIGGLDMLGMVGTFLACAQYSLPCVVDGLISITGLLIASRLAPAVLDYVFASHHSTEPGYSLVCQALDLSAFLQLDMRLGEGTGCPLAFFLMEHAVYTIEQMPTFAQGKLRQEDYIDIRQQLKNNHIRKER